jgi:bifunctional DNA-binding transcriptional regulator/antitoxin component of YhaV-PrlF toxin-antitoxin module
MLADKSKDSYTDNPRISMSEKRQVLMTKRGIVTIPQVLRKRYNLKTGDVFTLIDLDGVFVLSPQRSIVDELAGEITEVLTKKGETLESMLKVLKERRRRHGRKKAS